MPLNLDPEMREDMGENTDQANQTKLKQHILHVMRIITIPPVMAFLLLTILFALRPEIFGGWLAYALSLLFIVVLPVIGYPLQPVLPYFKHQGREGQRNLAIIAAVAGYLGSLVFAVAADVSAGLWLIYLTYTLSGLGIAVFNKLLHIRASGHACGAAGPLAMLCYQFGATALWGLPLLALVFYSSVQSKRHTLAQMIWGALIPVAAMLVSIRLTAQTG